MNEQCWMQEFIETAEPHNSVSIIKTIAVRERSLLYGKEALKTSEIAAKFAKELFRYADREMVVVVSVDSKCQPLSLEVVAIGTINACIVSPREIFKHAILNNAAGIIVFHNHPSGDCEPSYEDISITQKLIESGKILCITVLDHIIVGNGDDFLSLKKEKVIDFSKPEPDYMNLNSASSL